MSTDGLRWGKISVDQRWNYRNREWNAERTHRRRAKLRRWVNEMKRRSGCTRCGINDPACLDYLHSDGAEKEMGIGMMITYGYGKTALESERRKCSMLCANCHRDEHYSPPTEALRTWVCERNRASGGCLVCEIRNVVCLEFHHVTGEKDDPLARMVADGRSKSVVRNEIEKYTVLGADCHRKRHFEPPDYLDGKHDNNK